VTGAPHVFRFKPRYAALGYAAGGVGGLLLVAGAVLAAAMPIVVGVVGAGLGAAYLRSPAWKLEVAVDDAGLEVRSPDKLRFRLAWSEIVRVVAAPNKTCFVDGGTPATSLLVPGVGAPAPYDIANKAQLYDLIVANVPAERIERVASIETAKLASAPAKS
jgi:hypothetical protein